MKKLFYLFVLAISQNIYSQEIFKDISDRISNVDYIFEGVVLSTNPYKTLDGGQILTSNVIQVTKIFKGNIACGIIEMISNGGKVGDTEIHGSHCLELSKGSKGIFLAASTAKELPLNSVATFTIPDKIEPYYEWQSFIKYGLEDGNWKAYDLWQKFDSIAEVYNLVEFVTQLSYIDCNNGQGLTNKPTHISTPYYSNSVALSSGANVPRTQFDQIISLKKLNSRIAGKQAQAGTVDFSISNSKIIGSNPKYLEFDINIGADANQYIVNASVRIKYDPIAFGTNIVANNKISIQRRLAVADTTQYPYLTVQDLANNIFGVAAASGLAPTALRQYDINKEQLFHVKMEIAVCGTNGTVQFIHQDTMLSANYFEIMANGTGLNNFANINATQSITTPDCKPKINSFFPQTINGGVGDTLLISGYQFGNTRGAGNVYFFDANDPTAGMSLGLDDSDYIQWSDTLIIIKVPSVNIGNGSKQVLGTGTFKIVSNTQDNTTTSAPINIFYSLLNDKDANNSKSRFYHSNVSGNGGYKFYVDVAIFNNPAMMGVIKKVIDEWVCGTTINFELYKDTFGLPRLNNADGINLITYGALPANVIARCVTTNQTCTNGAGIKTRSISDIDVIISDFAGYTFTTDTTGTADVPFGWIDLYHVLLHEFGHGVGLSHKIDATKIMHYQVPVVPAGGLLAANRVVNLAQDQSAINGGLRQVDNSLQQVNVPGCLKVHTSVNGGNCTGYSTMIRIDEAHTMNISPNPFNDIVRITSNQPLSQISVSNIEGKVLYEAFDGKSSDVILNLSGYATGLYLLKVSAGYESKTLKIIHE